MDINILVVDDHKITRDGLCALISQQESMTVIGQAGDGHTAIKMARKYMPDIVIMDISIPELNGIETTIHILDEFPSIKIIGLSMHSDKRYVDGMFKAGASAYLLKNCAFDELVIAINTVLKGQAYISPQISNIVIKSYKDKLSSIPIKSRLDELTSRERQILQLISEGFKSDQIATRLCISVKTVSTHRSNIMDKLKSNNIADLTKIAIKEGLTSLDI